MIFYKMKLFKFFSLTLFGEEQVSPAGRSTRRAGVNKSTTVILRFATGATLASGGQVSFLKIKSVRKFEMRPGKFANLVPLAVKFYYEDHKV